MTIGAAQKVLLLRCMRIISRFDIYVCPVAVNFPADRAGATAD